MKNGIQPLNVRRIASKPYSRAPDGNQSWRHRAVDLHVLVRGPAGLLQEMPGFFEGARGVLHSLEVPTLLSSYVLRLITSLFFLIIVWSGDDI